MAAAACPLVARTCHDSCGVDFCTLEQGCVLDQCFSKINRLDLQIRRSSTRVFGNYVVAAEMNGSRFTFYMLHPSSIKFVDSSVVRVPILSPLTHLFPSYRSLTLYPFVPTVAPLRSHASKSPSHIPRIQIVSSLESLRSKKNGNCKIRWEEREFDLICSTSGGSGSCIFGY